MGHLASNQVMNRYTMSLQSHGYVVCAIDHTYQCLSTKGEDGHTILIDNNYVKEMSARGCKGRQTKCYEYYQKWMKTRTDDINFVTIYTY